ncbi:MAG: UDP-N-acetylglucosamine 2-epimerase (non-hydrolyzing) [Elusimicrobia bacterium]|nr:UDP-N-acetylglucosamine 2-epimerase (non-hydrolyzing) [Elusimicrobiota bacterium]
MHILHVVGARPNFMKAAPVIAAFARRGARQTIVHTGQHYDQAMSDIFFRQLGLPRPDYDLEVGSGTHAAQFAQVMLRFEPVLLERKPDWVLVYGDINSTAAAALVSVKLGMRTAHVEAGLRSRDRGMPEERNRIVTDHLCDLLLTPSQDGNDNLRAEGIPAERVRLVGNVMIDTLVRLLPEAKALSPLGYSQACRPFALVTLHRPSNVDDMTDFYALLDALEELAGRIPVIFPMHPRTRDRLKGRKIEKLTITEPLGYLEFLALQSRAAFVVTDSGGIQEETTYLGVPCLTVRKNTERPVTVTLGTNELVGTDVGVLRMRAQTIIEGSWKKGKVPPLWEGKASERVVDAVYEAKA